MAVDKNKAYPYTIPKTSSWFDYNTISEIEKQFFPEFFNGLKKSKTPDVYKTYRNFIIQLYMKDPKYYLTGKYLNIVL